MKLRELFDKMTPGLLDTHVTVTAPNGSELHIKDVEVTTDGEVRLITTRFPQAEIPK